MLDRLLGRASLQAEIEELTEERDSLAAQLEAEADRRREAARKRQEAEERVNRLEDRIAELEDRVERADRDREPSPRGRETPGPDRLAELLSRLRSVETGREGALSAMVGESPPAAVTEAFGDRAGLVRRVAPALVYRDDAGLVSVALEPPLPPEPFHEWGSQFRVDAAWVQPTGRFAFALVRSDTFALGVYEGRDRLRFEGFQSDVTAEHDKGGFSQARFERRRDEEITDHLDRCRDCLLALDTTTESTADPETNTDEGAGANTDEGAGESAGDSAGANVGGAKTSVSDLDRLVVVGEETALSALDLEFPSRFPPVHTATVDATGHDEDALDRAFRDFWTTRVTLL
jgi:hypothetical protein